MERIRGEGQNFSEVVAPQEEEEDLQLQSSRRGFEDHVNPLKHEFYLNNKKNSVRTSECAPRFRYEDQQVDGSGKNLYLL